MKRVLTFVVAIAVTAFAGTVEAQNRGERGGRGGSPEEFVDRMFENDANSDGKLSADELGERGARMMDRADADSDGFLTKDELKTMMENRGGRGEGGGPGARGEGGGRGERGEGGRGGAGGGRGGPGGAPGGMSRLFEMLPIMKALDKDGNGELSEAEIKNAVKAIQTLDKDKNGKISTEEMMPDMSQFGRGGRGGAGGRERGRPQRPERDDDT